MKKLLFVVVALGLSTGFAKVEKTQSRKVADSGYNFLEDYTYKGQKYQVNTVSPFAIAKELIAANNKTFGGKYEQLESIEGLAEGRVIFGKDETIVSSSIGNTAFCINTNGRRWVSFLNDKSGDLWNQKSFWKRCLYKSMDVKENLTE